MLFGQEHVQRYLETDGEVGHEWQGTVTLILTTTGRKSGQQRQSPLIYQQDGDSYVVVASNGGDDKAPSWFLNLSDNPDVQVQVKGDRFAARARVAGPDEKPRLWKLMAATWPAYDDYQRKTEREIPLVVLDRA